MPLSLLLFPHQLFPCQADMQAYSSFAGQVNHEILGYTVLVISHMARNCQALTVAG